MSKRFKDRWYTTILCLLVMTELFGLDRPTTQYCVALDNCVSALELNQHARP